MPHITREDGERFIIPSYRDIISAKKASLLKKEIMLLSASYGDYITIQKKSISQYEVAFSIEPGYLLGECAWQYFKRPADMIYCEAIPNTNEAVLVIVKSGSVYLDGSFPIDSIVDELLIFKSQQNNFDIYTYGDVPISQAPEDGKFSFDFSSVKSFVELEAPVFPTLPSVKAFQLQPVDSVLASHGIGVLPVKQMVIAFLVMAAMAFVIWFITFHKEKVPEAIVSVVEVHVSPYQAYVDQLNTPDPVNEIQQIFNATNMIYSIPGWTATSIDYETGLPGKLKATVQSKGARLGILFDWATKSNATVLISPSAVYVNMLVFSPKRPPTKNISSLQNVIASMIDNLSYIIPGNNLKLGPILDRKQFKETMLTIDFGPITPILLLSIGEQLKGLPLVLSKMSIHLDDAGVSGTIVLKALGN